jgi:hypothetical protein
MTTLEPQPSAKFWEALGAYMRRRIAEQVAEDTSAPTVSRTETVENLKNWTNGLKVVWFTFSDYDDWRYAEMSRQQFDTGLKIGGWSAYRIGSPV